VIDPILKKVMEKRGDALHEAEQWETWIADSDDVARSFRDDVARCSEMMSLAVSA
jgi:hypothetical protein